MVLRNTHTKSVKAAQREDQKVIQKAMNLFFLLFLLVGFVLGGGAAVLYYFDINSFLKELKTLEFHSLELQGTAITEELNHISGDVLFLAKQNELILLLGSGSEEQIKAMQLEYVRLAESKKVYDQIRYLDATGMERVRVNDRDGQIETVPANQLQNKGDRYYFKECFALGDRDIFISPLDLNIENGQVEHPLTPMMRFGTPVFDSAGNKRGIVLINYTAKTLLKRIIHSGIASEGTKMLMNQSGYWLLHPDESREWGFMFKGREKDSFAEDYPDEWQRITATQQGQISTDNGLFTYKKIYPLAEGRSFSTSLNPQVDGGSADDARRGYYWILLSHIRPEILNGYTHSLLFRLFMGGGALFMVVAFGAWHLALAISRRRMYQAQLIALALYDPLTGLPNRKLFFDRLTAGIANARRYDRKLALLYIDLDGFKEVNDTKGHQAGDELLIKVSGTLSTSVRSTDTVARLGGDEFAIILSEVHNVEEAARVGEKIVRELCRSFDLKAGTVEIGGSIGVAVFPDHEDTENELLKSADQAMYESKSKGKNTCTVASARSRKA
ncbi:MULTISPECIES: diguanylate cyclase [unclassified Pseudodesulfovibrio]|uniref:diguanylate cyclase domain-containing protein n=1 Tax=unclassified Pseudodesulfovibrio TaxID=2661612 RepID=UPI000FEC0BE1|nr:MULTISPECIES: diguanylate cyclase [unclassified Pseudodesulfovibrio]MCJ2165933.1 sensor domain-containing diguanylate cyclase [Pseudodesulfovibrio sp. S3-i]RWU02609.1 GGDEF domain-containing protein [Pseudodesulfovibrio sp. S3]